jgi:hypothetical protein
LQATFVLSCSFVFGQASRCAASSRDRTFHRARVCTCMPRHVNNRLHVLHRPSSSTRSMARGEPNPPMHRTRTCALPCCGTLVHRVQVRAGDRGIRLLLVAAARSAARPAEKDAFGERPRAVRCSPPLASPPARSARRAFASRPPAPLRSLLAALRSRPALPPPRPQRRPGPLRR